MPSPEGKTLVRVSKTRMSDAGIEGLCHYDDGTSEWRAPDVVSVEGDITRADGSREKATITDVKIGVGSCE